MLNQAFIEDVDSGLGHTKKSLSSKYFYDEHGDELFQKIMQLPEYYLTRAELEIFQRQTQDIIKSIHSAPSQHFELIELGAGDGTKTLELLRALSHGEYDYNYIPVDISPNVLDILKNKVTAAVPSANITPMQGDYFQILKQLMQSPAPKVVLYLGSNMGNLTDEQAKQFLHQIDQNLSSGDKLLLGVDKIKSEDIVLPAYNDKQGITRAFNLNLLSRINRELGGNFNVDQFEHTPEYMQKDGIAKSFLTSKVEQKVEISATGKTYHFEKNEKIHMEISRKYSRPVVEALLHNTRLNILDEFTDSKDYFSDFVIEKA